MRILIYDSDFISSGVEYPIQVAINKLGHDAVMFNWRKYLFTYKNNQLIHRIKDKIGFELICLKINKSLRTTIQNNKFDLVLVVRGEHLFPETIQFIKNNGIIIVNWSSDDLFNHLNGSRFVKESFDLYDIHFSPRPHLQQEYLKSGAKDFKFINWYYRKELVFSQFHILNPQYYFDISFVGSWSSRRQIILSHLANYELTIHGWGWNKKKIDEKFKNWKIGDSVSMIDMTKIFNQSKININIFTIENRDLINPRNFDLSVCGAFQISERSDQLLTYFKEDHDLVCFSTNEELESKVKFYLDKPHLRDKIRFSAYKKVINGTNELYDRVREIITYIMSK